MGTSSKILITGATGIIGSNVTMASVRLGHPTFALTRTTTPSDPAKARLLQSFQDAGMTLLVGDLTDQASLVAALKQVDFVISIITGRQLGSQLNVLAAAKEAGTIKRILPSEFGLDADRLEIDVPLLEPLYGTQRTVRRAVEASGIAYTFVVSNSFASYYAANLCQDGLTAPPRDGKLVVVGDGNARAVFNTEEDVGTFTIRSVDDPRAANKVLHISPKENVLSQNELIALWEKKIGRIFEKEFLDREGVLKSIDELPYPYSFYRALKYSMFVKGDETGFDLDPSRDVETSALYPDVKYTTMSEYLDRFV